MAFVHKARIIIVFLAGTVLLLISCSEEPQLWKVESEEQVICDYISCHPDQYSEFHKLIEATEMASLLKVRGPFTLFLPTNEAMLAYYASKDLNSLEEFSESFLNDLILNHIVAMEISTGEIGLGTLREPNALGDHLVTEFQGSDIIVSKCAKIIERDIRAANGYIHVIDQVLDPVTEDIYHVTASDPSYTIFTEGLRMTGLKDTLQLISFPYGESIARTRFTLLGVPDSIYHRYGIHNVQDLIEWNGANPDSIRFPDNLFYMYMDYHCLHGTYFLSDLETGSYPVLSRNNNLSITIDNEDYKIDLIDSTKSYTGFIVPASNIPAKNGALHALDDILPLSNPKPVRMLFETTDFFDLKQGDYYLNYYQRFFDGENALAKIKWKGDYLLYYYKYHGYIGSVMKNCDCLSMTGWWQISVTFPKVMKGKYEVYIGQPPWEPPICAVYIDDIYTGIYRGSGPSNVGSDAGLKMVAELDFPSSVEHTITLRSMNSGQIFWDYVIFKPVE